MRRILFVDDEQQVLDGLQNLLRKQRKQWEMHFAAGPKPALELLAQHTFDVVVSDMRMPELDGAALLAKVRELQPQAARIILSGYSDRDAVMRALPVAHQYLSKPCDADLLRLVVERSCGLQSLLENANLRAVVGRLEKLPSVPQTYWELTHAMSDPDAGIPDVTPIVEGDPAMTARVLQLVNSAYFGLARKVTSVQQAVGLLGLELLRALALTAHAFSASVDRAIEGFDLGRLKDHSVAVGQLAKKLCVDPGKGNEAFTAGMVHDVGKLVLACGVPDRFEEALRQATASKRPLHEVERELLGVSHAEVGAYLLGVWGLPLAIVEAVAYHHQPALVPEGDADVITSVHVANALSDPSTSDAKLDLAFLERTGAVRHLPQWRATAEKLRG